MLHSAIVVRSKEAIEGYGLFSTRFIAKGTLIWTLIEPTFTWEEIQTWQGEKLKDFKRYGFQCGVNSFSLPTGPSREMNHSCDPNAWWAGKNKIVARRDIAENEEVTYDYASCDIELEFNMACPTALWDKLPIGSNIGDQLYKGADALACDNFESFYANYLMAHSREPEGIVINGSDPDYLTDRIAECNLPNNEKMTLIDHHSYLPDDILCKVDRAAMGVSLETRIPLLDHTVVEFAAKVPMNIKNFDDQTKWPLKQVLFKYVPRELIERPKKGFGIPLAKWLRGGLKNWAYELLNEEKIKSQGFFYPEMVNKLWSEHQNGSRNWSYLLWNILMFQAWYEKNHP